MNKTHFASSITAKNSIHDIVDRFLRSAVVFVLTIGLWTIAPSRSVIAKDTTTTAIDCKGAQTGDTLSLLYMWAGTEETKFKDILQPLVDDCGIVLQTQNTRDPVLFDQLINSATPPDVAFWSTGKYVQYQEKLQDLTALGADASSYSDFFIQLGTVNGRWLGLPVKADLKSLVWYSPAAFQAASYAVPTTWNELDALVEKMKADGKVPWSMGFESGAATGWSGSDFIQDILLVQQGPDYVRDIISGKVRYDDAGVKQAYQTYGEWAKDPAYTAGGVIGTLTTSYTDAINKVFSNPAEAMMVKQAGFAGSIIASTHPTYTFGTSYDFFVMPGVQGLQAGSDWLMAFKDTPAVRALVAYLSSSAGGVNWAKEGFDLSPNKNAAGNYTDPVLIKEAAALGQAQDLTPDLGDTIGGSFQSAEWQAIIDYVNGGNLDIALAAAAKVQPFFAHLYLPVVER